MKPLAFIHAALLAVLLAGCGGGGGGDAEPQAESVAEAPAQPAPVAEPAKPDPWQRITTAPWAWRDGAGLLAKDGGLYLLGGWNGDGAPTASEVWFTRDLVTWEFKGNAPWTGRHGAGWLVHDDRLYVIGGDYLDDVWSSPDGVTWTQHAAGASFGKMYAPNAASFNGKLLVYNGMREDGTGSPDVWQSEDGGVTWSLLAAAPYAGRALIHGAAVHNGRLYVIGGGLKAGVPPNGDDWPTDTVAEFTDVWSTADGVDWRMETSDMGFPARTHFAVLGTPHGCYVANGSITKQRFTTGEVYHSPDCIRFSPVESPMPRVHATSLVEFDGKIVILGGHGTAVGSSVWVYTPAGSGRG
jgi:hypothetical protein